MAYRLRYQCWVDWVPAGVGLGIAASPINGPGMVPAGPAQTLGFFNGETGGYPPTSTTFTSGDVTNLTNSMAADLSAQMSTAAVLTRVQNFASGGG